MGLNKKTLLMDKEKHVECVSLISWFCKDIQQEVQVAFPEQSKFFSAQLPQTTNSTLVCITCRLC